MNTISKIMENELQSLRKREVVEVGEEEEEEEVLPNISSTSFTSNNNNNISKGIPIYNQDSTYSNQYYATQSSPQFVNHLKIPPFSLTPASQPHNSYWDSSSSTGDQQFAQYSQSSYIPSDYPRQHQQSQNLQQSSPALSSSTSTTSSTSISTNFHPYSSPQTNRQRSNSLASSSSQLNLRSFSLPLSMTSNPIQQQFETPVESSPPPLFSDNSTYAQSPPQSGPMRRATIGSADERNVRSDIDLKEDKRKRNAESSARHREKSRLRLQYLESKCSDLEKELEEVRSGRDEVEGIRQRDELIEELRRENYELRIRENQYLAHSAGSSSRESHTNSPRPSHYHNTHANPTSPEQINNPLFPPPTPILSQQQFDSTLIQPTSITNPQHHQQYYHAESSIHSHYLQHQFQSHPPAQNQNQLDSEFRYQIHPQQQQQQYQQQFQHPHSQNSSSSPENHNPYRQLSQLILPSNYSSNTNNNQPQFQYRQQDELEGDLDVEDISPLSARSIAGSIRSIASELSIGAGSVSSGFGDGSGSANGSLGDVRIARASGGE